MRPSLACTGLLYIVWTLYVTSNFTNRRYSVYRYSSIDEIWDRRPVERRFEEPYITEVQRSGRFTVNVWGWMSAISSGCLIRIEGRNNAEQYVEMLENHCVPSFMERFPDGNFVFMHDRSPIHTARRSTAALERLRRENGFRIMDWPAKGQDMNPIENVWAEMVRIVNHENVANPNQLFDAVHNAWEN